METSGNESVRLKKKYRWTSLVYDILDYPWERLYRKWRPKILENVRGDVIEAGVGTGRNLSHYSSDVNLTAIDLSPSMLDRASRRKKKAKCDVTLICADATVLHHIPENSFDWYVSTFLYCVLPAPLQTPAISEMRRILKPGGKFKLLEMIYSADKKIRERQMRFAKFVEKVYGARFDRGTLEVIEGIEGLEITSTRFLKDDVYLLIEGRKTDA
ncbi:MAG: class I SAM-dependent methyltransferase [Planctomycetes bacterium]|nr:class I SAM-dependent methyltransferase [Planctomycetota bacterium]